MSPLFFAIAITTATIAAAAAGTYEQGVCDGIRATGVHPPTVNIIAIIADGRSQRYFRCNGTNPTNPTNPTDTSGPTVFVHPDGGLRGLLRQALRQPACFASEGQFLAQGSYLSRRHPLYGLRFAGQPPTDINASRIGISTG